MVSLKAIRAANNSIPSSPRVAVFLGATSGIGLAALEALLQNTTPSKVYIIGRSQSKFASSLDNLGNLNKNTKLVFIEAQVSLLKEVDRVCKSIDAQESHVDLLWLSQGGLSGGPRHTNEGLNADFAITYYSRTLFMHKLMPLLNQSSDPRVISVLSPGQEGTVNLSDLGLLDPRNYSFWGSMKQGVTMMSLTMKEMSRANPRVSFMHTNPGFVSTDVHYKLADSWTGFMALFGWVLKRILLPLVSLFTWTAEEAGQVGLYELTDEKYNASAGQNFFRLRENGEEEKASSILSKYEGNGMVKEVWDHTLETYDRVLA